MKTNKSPKKKSTAKSAVVKKAAVKKAVVKQLSNKPSLLVGKSVPAFEVRATGDKSIALKGLKGKKVVLYFYPKDSTPGCTIEGQDFSRLLAQFRDQGAEVFGVSRDSLKSHENFKTKQKYEVDLLSDEDEALCDIFGVLKMKNMYGRQVRGIERSTFVIDENGKLVKEWRGVKVAGHAEEVLNFIKSLE